VGRQAIALSDQTVIGPDIKKRHIEKNCFLRPREGSMKWALVAALLCCWTSQAASSRIVSPYGCQGFYGVSNDSTPWLSVARGPGFNLDHTYQYWLTKANIYVINAEYASPPTPSSLFFFALTLSRH
jgi:hypothetical protein